ILDVDGRIIAILLGKPDDPDWDAVVKDAHRAFERARRLALARGVLRKKNTKHRRGNYTALTTGVSFGGGQQRPGNLVNAHELQKIINYLLNKPSVRRLAAFQSSGLARYAPKLFRYYVDTMNVLFEKYPHLIKNFPNSVFPAATFNCGPSAVTNEHADYLNVIHGLCGVSATGKFDHRRGGAFFMKQIKLLIDFPAGSSMLVPSAFMDHGNTPIEAGESRCSMTQYAAGGLFRWVQYGCRSRASLLSQPGGKELVASFNGVPRSRWKWALDLFSKVDELDADHRNVFSQ
ncbi:hypothetical protein C8J57DRAFT_1064979, partial [Mycena rebaudengoi]